MTERQNIIVVVPKGWEGVRNLWPRLQSLVLEWIGAPKTLSVQDFAIGSTKDAAVGDLPTKDILPQASENEIVALYPSDPKRGAVLMLHEGAYDLIVLALALHGSAIERLIRTWGVVGDAAQAVLVGNELEVEHSQVTELLRSGMLPSELDLCEAAIIGSEGGSTRMGGRELPYGGSLLLR